jgi:hypothetical protein
MSEETSQRDFLKKIIGQLERDEEALDTHTARRLREGRQRALEINVRPSLRVFPGWITISGIASAVVLIIAVSLWLGSPRPVTPLHNIEDMEVLNSPEQLEFYRDLDFYRWLDREHDAH